MSFKKKIIFRNYMHKTKYFYLLKKEDQNFSSPEHFFKESKINSKTYKFVLR